MITVGRPLSIARRPAGAGHRHGPDRPARVPIWYEREVSERRVADPDRGWRRGAAHRRRIRHRDGDGGVAAERARRSSTRSARVGTSRLSRRRIRRRSERRSSTSGGASCSSRGSTWATSSATAWRSRRRPARPTPAAARTVRSCACRSPTSSATTTRRFATEGLEFIPEGAAKRGNRRHVRFSRLSAQSVRLRVSRAASDVPDFVARCTVFLPRHRPNFHGPLRPPRLHRRRHLRPRRDVPAVLPRGEDRARQPAADHTPRVLLRLHRHRARVAARLPRDRARSRAVPRAHAGDGAGEARLRPSRRGPLHAGTRYARDAPLRRDRPRARLLFFLSWRRVGVASLA